jgi:hypothetical protein
MKLSLVILTILSIHIMKLSAYENTSSWNSDSEQIQVLIKTKEEQEIDSCIDGFLKTNISLKGDSIHIECNLHKPKRSPLNSAKRTLSKFVIRGKKQEPQVNPMSLSVPQEKASKIESVKTTISLPIPRRKKPKSNDSDDDAVSESHSENEADDASPVIVLNVFKSIEYKEIIHFKCEKHGMTKLTVYFKELDHIRIAEIYFKGNVTVEEVQKHFLEPILEKFPEIRKKRTQFLEEFLKRVNLINLDFPAFHNKQVSLNVRINHFKGNDINTYVQHYFGVDLNVLENDPCHLRFKKLDLFTNNLENMNKMNEKVFKTLKEGFDLIRERVQEEAKELIGENNKDDEEGSQEITGEDINSYNGENDLNEIKQDGSKILGNNKENKSKEKKLEKFESLIMKDCPKGNNYKFTHYVYYKILKLGV